MSWYIPHASPQSFSIHWPGSNSATARMFSSVLRLGVQRWSHSHQAVKTVALNQADFALRTGDSARAILGIGVLGMPNAERRPLELQVSTTS